MRNPIRLKNLRPRLLPYVLIGIALVAWRRPPMLGFAAGVPFVLAGALLRAWAAGHLVKNDRLTTTGPYAHLRHPLYIGTLLIATGFAAILGGGYALALAALVWPWFALHYFPRKELSESARLAALHGDAFLDYRANVPALWPRLTAHRSAPRPDDSRFRFERYSDNNELGTLLAVLAGLVVLWVRARWGGA